MKAGLAEARCLLEAAELAAEAEVGRFHSTVEEAANHCLRQLAAEAAVRSCHCLYSVAAEAEMQHY